MRKRQSNPGEPEIVRHPHFRHGIAPFDIFKRCEGADELYKWIYALTDLKIPRKSVCQHHNAPFDYVRASYFDENDLVVWAPRGGGKTRLAALLTLLDMMHKPGCSIRVLGGSMQQSLRIWDHLWPELADKVWGNLGRIPRGPRVSLRNGSNAEAIPHSERAVRGLHIQKLRCDEVELFDPAIYEAAMMTTRSLTLSDGHVVRGSIESLSTLHKQWGLMNDVVNKAIAADKPVIKWCILDVLEKCPPERDCKTCPLQPDCDGAAKRADGFVRIDDAIAIKQRSSRESWESEMLCLRPSTKGAVFPTFDPSVHLKNAVPSGQFTLSLDFGFSSPFVCLWIADDGANVHVFDEYVQSGLSLDEHLVEIEGRPWGRIRNITCDPAGNNRSDQTAESNVVLLRKRQYIVRYRKSIIADGLELIRTALKTGDGRRSLFIHPRCTQLIRAMQGYHYASSRSEIPVKDGQHDHLIDALRYYFVNRWHRDHCKVTVRAY